MYVNCQQHYLCLLHVGDGDVGEVLRGVRAHLRDPERVPLERRLDRLQQLQHLAQGYHRGPGQCMVKMRGSVPLL